MAGKIEGKRRFDKRGSAMYARAAMLGEPHVVVEEQGSGSGLRFAFAFMSVLALALAGALAYGFLRYDAGQKQLARLADELENVRGNDGTASELDTARSEIARLEALLSAHSTGAANSSADTAGGGENVAGADAGSAGSELAVALGENERLRQRQLEERAELEAARARIVALEAEIAGDAAAGAGGDEGVDPLAALDAARIELRLAAGERDAAREQVDRLLARVAELETVAAPAISPPLAVVDDNAALELQAARDEIQALKTNIAELETAMLADGQAGDGTGANLADLRRRVEAQTIELAARDRLIEETTARATDLESRLAGQAGSLEELAQTEQRLREAQDEARLAGEQRVALEQELAARDRLLADAQAGIVALEAELLQAQEQGSGEILGLQSELDSLRLSTEAQIADLAAERDAIERGRDALEADLLAARNAAAEAERRMTGLEAEIAANKEVEGTAVAESLAQLDTLRAQGESERQALTAERDAAIRDLETVRGELAGAVAQADAERSALTDERDAALASLEAVRQDLASAGDDASLELQQKTEQLEAVRSELEMARGELAARAETTSGELRTITGERDAALAELEAMRAELSAARTEAQAEVAQEIESLRQARDAAQAQLADLQTELGSLRADRGAEAEALAMARDEAVAEAEALRTELAGAKSASEAEIAALAEERDTAVAELEALRAGMDAGESAAMAEQRLSQENATRLWHSSQRCALSWLRRRSRMPQRSRRSRPSAMRR
ncbi:MAG: hypothetical protein R3C97_05400 [Geminicoccaceae bacterium]